VKHNRHSLVVGQHKCPPRALLLGKNLLVGQKDALLLGSSPSSSEKPLDTCTDLLLFHDCCTSLIDAGSTYSTLMIYDECKYVLFSRFQTTR